eukprot:2840533-Rhodomonas_salina.2
MAVSGIAWRVWDTAYGATQCLWSGRVEERANRATRGSRATWIANTFKAILAPPESPPSPPPPPPPPPPPSSSLLCQNCTFLVGHTLCQYWTPPGARVKR